MRNVKKELQIRKEETNSLICFVKHLEEKFILEREDHFKKKANEEINVLINYLKEKDLVNKGGKAR